MATAQAHGGFWDKEITMSIVFRSLMGNGWYDSGSGALLGTVDPNQQAYNNFYAANNTGMVSAPQYQAAPAYTPQTTYDTKPAQVAAPAPASATGVNNYSYRYADGSTGNTPWKQDGAGNYLMNSAGGFLEEGLFQGRTMPDGSVNGATLGNVTADGRVNTYGGYSSSADEWFSGANSNVFADRGATGANPAGQRAPDGFGFGTQAAGAGAAPQTGGASTQPAYGPTGGNLGIGAPQQGSGMPAASGTSGGVSGAMSGQNPYLSQMGDALTQTMTRNWQRNVQPQIASSAMATGGYGGSRQGVIEANSANDLNQGIGSALAGLYGNGYNTALNYDLGLRGNELGYANLDRSINNDNLNWQLQGANFGLGVYDRMQQGNQTGLNAATNIQNTPYNYWQNFSNQANSIGQGYGTQTQSTGGNPLMGALGGAQLGNQAANWWSSQSGNNAQPYNPATAGAMAASLNANGYWPG